MTPGGVALYWDFDNIHLSAARLGTPAVGGGGVYVGGRAVDMDAIVAVARAHGRVDVNRAYANWAAFGTPYAAVLNRHAVQLVQLYYRGPHGKNGADIRLSIDVADDLARFPQLHTVVIVGGDSDFIAVAQHVHARGKRVVGVGVRATTNKFWALACDEFIWYDDVLLQRGVLPGKRGLKTAGSAKEGVSPEEGPSPYSDELGEGVPEATTAAPRPVGEAAAVPNGASLETRARALLCRAILAEMEVTKLPYARKASIKPRMARLDNPADPVFSRHSPFYTGFKEWLGDLCGDVVVSSQGESGQPEFRLAPGAAKRLGVATKGKGKAAAVATGPRAAAPAAVQTGVASETKASGSHPPVVPPLAKADLAEDANVDGEAPVNEKAPVTDKVPPDDEGFVDGEFPVTDESPVSDGVPVTGKMLVTDEALLDDVAPEDGECRLPAGASTAPVTSASADSAEPASSPHGRQPGCRGEPPSPPSWHAWGSSDGTPEEPLLSIVDAAWLDRLDGDGSGSDCGGERRFVLVGGPAGVATGSVRGGA